ncbi:MAG: ABC transporter permease [Bauldia sp.]|nr:ABC transporter permease [Bauldia sp.]MCW5718706.1 ABC transporter permease [Bauldia sp.]
MNEFAFWTAIQLGLIYGFVALGVYLSFRVLDFPDLTVDGSFPLGAAVTAALIVSGVNPWIALVVSIFAGGAAGLVTAFLSVRFHILHLLASILTMFALFSINIRVMGSSNLSLARQETILTPLTSLDLGITAAQTRVIFIAVLLLVTGAALSWLLTSSFGLALRAAGANPRMARAQGISTSASTYFGMALSNGLVALGGSLFAQTQLFADVTVGAGTIVIGLASVIIGESLLRFRGIWIALAGCVLGSIIYRLVYQWALTKDQICLGFCLDFRPSDLNLIAATIIALALILPRLGAGKGSIR